MNHYSCLAFMWYSYNIIIRSKQSCFVFILHHSFSFFLSLNAAKLRLWLNTEPKRGIITAKSGEGPANFGALRSHRWQVSFSCQELGNARKRYLNLFGSAGKFRRNSLWLSQFRKKCGFPLREIVSELVSPSSGSSFWGSIVVVEAWKVWGSREKRSR